MADENRVVISEGIEREDWLMITSQLASYNTEQSKGLSKEPGIHIGLTLKDGDSIVGAISCKAFYKNLMIDHLWIDEKYRKRGYGTKLMVEAERIAKEKGCISALTDTYSFQAPEFYNKMGYKPFGVFEGYPDGIKKFFLGKNL